MKLLLKALNMGYSGASEMLFANYYLGENGFPKNYELAYYYSEITKKLSAKTLNSFDIEVEKKLPSGEVVYERAFSENSQKELDEKVKKFLSKVKPNMFWDETTVDLY